MRKARILNYRDVGEGSTVVLLHGYLASSHYWNKVVTELSKKHRVIAIDLLGFGKSPKPYLSKYDYEAQVASIHATLQHIGLRRKFTLMGHSMGALIALRYANVYQSSVKKLVLANMPIFLSRQEAKQDVLGTSMCTGLACDLDYTTSSGPSFCYQLSYVCYQAGPDSTASTCFQNRAWSRLRSLRNVIYSATIEADLLRLEVTTTLVTGLNDRKQYLTNLPKLRQATHIMSRTVNGGHHLPLTNPQLFVRLV